jgi:predicted nucleotidyltransferase
MTTVLTLAERRKRKLEGMREAMARLDERLAAYGRDHGGRFIRYGSSLTGRLHGASDVDILADFEDDRAAVEACRVADEICAALGLVPDSRPSGWMSDDFVARVRAEGIPLP